MLGLSAPGPDSLYQVAKSRWLSRVCRLSTQWNAETAQTSNVGVACLTGVLSDH